MSPNTIMQAKKKLSIFNKKRFENKEERLKTSIATKNGMTPEIRKHMSEMKKGKHPPNYGKCSKYTHICKFCKTEFKSYNKNRKYCKYNCFLEYKKEKNENKKC